MFPSASLSFRQFLPDDRPLASLFLKYLLEKTCLRKSFLCPFEIEHFSQLLASSTAQHCLFQRPGSYPFEIPPQKGRALISQRLRRRRSLFRKNKFSERDGLISWTNLPIMSSGNFPLAQPSLKTFLPFVSAEHSPAVPTLPLTKSSLCVSLHLCNFYMVALMMTVIIGPLVCLPKYDANLRSVNTTCSSLDPPEMPYIQCLLDGSFKSE